jgi:hypothetical protein
MKSLRFLRTSLTGAALVVLLLAAAIHSFAKDGRDFAGSYRITQATPHEDQMILTFEARLQNNSGADLKQAVVTIHPSRPAPAPLAQFQPVKAWKNHAHVTLTQQLTVSKFEYDRWLKGSQPALMVIYHDANGQRWERFAQVSRRPGPASQTSQQ